MGKKNIVFLAGGQGSCYKNMGYGLYTKSAIFRKKLKQCEETIRDICGISILKKLYSEPLEFNPGTSVLDSTMAIFSIEYALAQYLKEFEIIPDFIAGASMGEYLSLTVTGVFSFEKMIRFLKFAADVFEKRKGESCMDTVFTDLSRFEEECDWKGKIELASINAPGFFTVSGQNEEMRKAEVSLKEKGIHMQKLNTALGFHSSCIDFAEKELIEYLDKENFRRKEVKLFSAVTGGRVEEISSLHLWKAIRQTTDIPKMVKSVAEKATETVFVDITPSGTLASYTKRTLKENKNIYTVLNSMSLDYDGTDEIRNNI